MDMDMLSRVFDILQRAGEMERIGQIMTIVYGVICVFGILNCLLGYRILRFWMMIFGFLIGAGAGFGVTYLSGVEDKMMIVGAMAGLGIVLAIVSFLVYRAGIFVLGFGIGISLSIYLVHPTSSFSFFLCILVGVGLGILAMRYAKGVIIIGTSILGGVLAGVSIAKIGGLEQFPYGIGMAVGIALLGMLIQFATNRRVVIEEEEYDPQEYEKARRSSDYVDTDDYLPRRKRERATGEEQKSQRNRKRREEHSKEHNSVQQKQVVDVPLEKKTRKRRLDDPAPEREETVVYRPKRTSASAGTGRSGSGNVNDRNVNNRNINNRNVRRNTYEDDYYDDYYDDEPIDEEDLDEQIIQEMMDEDDREGEEIWNRISGKNSRNTKNTKRNRNAR